MTIELQGLVVFGHHGYLEEERRLGQRFLVDLWVDVAGNATETDRIDETVDYRRPRRARPRGVRRPGAAVARGASRVPWPTASSSRFASVQRARVRVRKPDVVLDPPVDHAAVIVERTRG